MGSRDALDPQTAHEPLATVVISPLITLQQDKVEAIDDAAAPNSGRSAMVVLFDEVGYKTLAVGLGVQSDLLARPRSSHT